MAVQFIELAGQSYVLLPRQEYEQLTILAKAANLPPLPKPDRNGNVPAVAYAKASLARKIIRDRSDAGLSQKELASRAGVRVETLCRIETGKHVPSVATIEKLDRALQQVKTRQRKSSSR